MRSHRAMQAAGGEPVFSGHGGCSMQHLHTTLCLTGPKAGEAFSVSAGVRGHRPSGRQSGAARPGQKAGSVGAVSTGEGLVGTRVQAFGWEQAGSPEDPRESVVSGPPLLCGLRTLASLGWVQPCPFLEHEALWVQGHHFTWVSSVRGPLPGPDHTQSHWEGAGRWGHGAPMGKSQALALELSSPHIPQS